MAILRHFRKDLIRNAELTICHCLVRNIVCPAEFERRNPHETERVA